MCHDQGNHPGRPSSRTVVAGGSRRSQRRRRRDPDHGGVVIVEEPHALVPEVAAQDEDAPPLAHRRGGVEHADESLQARQAVGGGQVRRALRRGVECRPDGAAGAVHEGGDEPGGPGGRELGGLVEHVTDAGAHRGGVTAGDAQPVPQLEQGAPVSTITSGDEDGAAVGEADEAVVVVHGGGLAAGAALLRVPERAGDAGAAAGAVVGHVAAAQRQRVHRVGGPGLAGGGVGEELRGGGGVAGEAPGQGHQVALVRAVGRVVAGVAAHPPDRRGPPWQQHHHQDEHQNVDGRHGYLSVP